MDLSLRAPARAFLGMAGAAPWALPVARAWLPLGRVGAWMDGAFVLLCHRIPERTLSVAGVSMPVCSRCAGIFLGVALGALIALPRLNARRWRAVLAVSTVLMALDVLAQTVGVHPIWHATRLATGAAFGYAAALTLLASLDPVVARSSNAARAVG